MNAHESMVARDARVPGGDACGGTHDAAVCAPSARTWTSTSYLSTQSFFFMFADKLTRTLGFGFTFTSIHESGYHFLFRLAWR
jgi:hypothetical protein